MGKGRFKCYGLVLAFLLGLIAQVNPSFGMRDDGLCKASLRTLKSHILPRWKQIAYAGVLGAAFSTSGLWITPLTQTLNPPPPSQTDVRKKQTVLAMAALIDKKTQDLSRSSNTKADQEHLEAEIELLKILKTMNEEKRTELSASESKEALKFISQIQIPLFIFDTLHFVQSFKDGGTETTFPREVFNAGTPTEWQFMIQTVLQRHFNVWLLPSNPNPVISAELKLSPAGYEQANLSASLDLDRLANLLNLALKNKNHPTRSMCLANTTNAPVTSITAIKAGMALNSLTQISKTPHPNAGYLYNPQRGEIFQNILNYIQSFPGAVYGLRMEVKTQVELFSSLDGALPPVKK